MIALVAILLCVGLAVRYINKEKKKGVACIGCPQAGRCERAGKCHAIDNNAIRKGYEQKKL